MGNNQDTEFTLGTGKLLGLFFGMALICGVFFSLGYSMGKGAVPQPVASENPGLGTPVQGGSKPGPGKAAADVASNCAPDDSACNGDHAGSGASPAESEPSFFKAVKEDPAKAQLTQPAAEEPKTNTPELRGQPIAGFMVQVAAVSKQEDAEALVGALRKKQYPVLIVNNIPNSRLFHVQVGPFNDAKEAESMRTKLVGDGYNAILKK